MTTGPQHYLEGERLLAEAFAPPVREDAFALPSSPEGPDIALIAAAQAHFTAALAAATAMGHWNGADMPMPQPDRLAWKRAASELPEAERLSREAAEAERRETLEELRGTTRNVRATSTSEWFHTSVAAGCTGTSYDTDIDAILHEDAPPCPVHEPGDVVPAEDRLTPKLDALLNEEDPR